MAAAPSEDLDFSDLKKKKKKSSKKAALDLEAFEKELNQSKTQEAEEDEGGDEGAVPELDEGELGDDPFAGTGGGDAAVGLDTGSEPWLKSDRDYTYEEVRVLPLVQVIVDPDRHLL